jgi:uncharacterized protein (TIGR03435 family)
MKSGIFGLLMAAAAFGQNAPVTFEVATVKPAAPPQTGGAGRMVFSMGSRGGPGSSDPGRWTCNNCTIKMMLTQGYDVKSYQVTTPGWMDSERYEISAKIPEGTTKAQFGLMIQNLLAERFKLTLHRDSKEMQMFDLVVAKGGSKMKEHVEEAPKDASAEGAKDEPKDPEAALKARLEGMAVGRAARGGGNGPELDKNGYPVVQKGCKGCMMIINGKATMQADGETMEEFAKQLTNQVGKPVSDATGLKGKYDFALSFDGSGAMRGMMPGMTAGIAIGSVGPPPPPSSSGNTPVNGNDPDGGIPIAGAIQSQLGLKLEAKKGNVEMLIVDHAEKVPTEN